MPNLGILTTSDLGARGERKDTSGQAIREVMEAYGYTLVLYEVIPDELGLIRARLLDWSESGQVDLIVTTGGTGLGPRDVTPEATASVVERSVPGISEAMRMKTLSHTPLAMLSRGIAGTRANCLIVNLPGSPNGVRECLDVVLSALDHGVNILKGSPGH